MSTSEPKDIPSEPMYDFDDWFVTRYAELGPFTALTVLVDIGERDATPVASTFFHVIGDEARWKDIRKMFASAPGGWDGVAFYAVTSKGGGPMEDPLARIELRMVETRIDEDRLALNDGAFFDKRGRRMRIDEDGAGG